jgi:hypothetical protein
MIDRRNAWHGRRPKIPPELNRLARVVGHLAWDRQQIPVLLPVPDWQRPDWQHRPFDAALVRLGVSAFVRPLVPSDLIDVGPMGLEEYESWVLVELLPSGGRGRRILGLRLHDPENN